MIIVVDLETTSLNHNNGHMIEFAAVIDDLNNPKPLSHLPTFHSYILRDKYFGEPFALSMHAEIFRRIATREKPYNYLTPIGVFNNFKRFLINNKIPVTPDNTESPPTRINIIGKNFYAFDYRFLEDDEWFPNPNFVPHHRSLDVGSLYFNPMLDHALPSSEECLRRAGLEPIVKHTALEDSFMVVNLVRKYYNLEVPEPNTFIELIDRGTFDE